MGKWSADDAAALAEMAAYHDTMPAAVVIGGRSHAAARAKAKRMGLWGNNPQFARQLWWRENNRERRLVAAIAAGMSRSKIGAMLGITKNAVVGKADRMGLCKKAVPDYVPPRYAFDEIGPVDCRWGIGDPKEPDFHFCGAPAAYPRPYCAAHLAKAYIRL